MIGPLTRCRTAVPLVVLALWAAPSMTSLAQVPVGSELTPLLDQVAGARWEQRSKAFYRLLKLGADQGDSKGLQASVAALLRRHPHQADDLKAALTKALVADNRHVRRAASLPESYTDYYGDLIMAVAALNDPRTIDALAGALGTGSMVTGALAAFGDAAVEPVIARLEPGADRTIRRSACRVLQDMVAPGSRTPVKDEQHKRQIAQALASPACQDK